MKLELVRQVYHSVDVTTEQLKQFIEDFDEDDLIKYIVNNDKNPEELDTSMWVIDNDDVECGIITMSDLEDYLYELEKC